MVSFLNNEVVHKDGSVAMTGLLNLTGSDPSSANQATRKSYVDAQDILRTTFDEGTGRVQGGAYTPGTHQPIVQAGLSIQTTSSVGRFTVSFPQTFPQGIASVVVCNDSNGDVNQGDRIASVYSVAASSFQVLFLEDSAPFQLHLPVDTLTARCLWVAVGY